MANSTGLASIAPEEQADPVETATPSKSREINRLSAYSVTAEVECMRQTIFQIGVEKNTFDFFDFVQNWFSEF